MPMTPQNEFAIFYCMECLSVGQLDEHGRCDTCDSKAVWPAPPTEEQELEYMFKLAEEGAH